MVQSASSSDSMAQFMRVVNAARTRNANIAAPVAQKPAGISEVPSTLAELLASRVNNAPSVNSLDKPRILGGRIDVYA